MKVTLPSISVQPVRLTNKNSHCRNCNRPKYHPGQTVAQMPQREGVNEEPHTILFAVYPTMQSPSLPGRKGAQSQVYGRQTGLKNHLTLFPAGGNPQRSIALLTGNTGPSLTEASSGTGLPIANPARMIATSQKSCILKAISMIVDIENIEDRGRT